ncbi:MAG: hypothetical protein VW396_05125, partial [Ilumatobacter sp.]
LNLREDVRVGPIIRRGLAGCAVGAFARLWMRLITADRPEFTLSGSMLVVGAFGLLGLASGLTHALRPAGRGAGVIVRVGAGLLLIPLFFGAGAGMFPTVLFGSLAMHRNLWNQWVRLFCAALALVVPTVVVATTELTLGSILGLLMFATTYVTVIWFVGPIARSSVPSSSQVGLARTLGAKAGER